MTRAASGRPALRTEQRRRVGLGAKLGAKGTGPEPCSRRPAPPRLSNLLPVAPCHNAPSASLCLRCKGAGRLLLITLRTSSPTSSPLLTSTTRVLHKLFPPAAPLPWPPRTGVTRGPCLTRTRFCPGPEAGTNGCGKVRRDPEGRNVFH